MKEKAKPARLDVRLDASRALLRSLIRVPLTSLAGFDRKRHRVPDHFHASADVFVRSLSEASIREETQLVYRAAKAALGLVRDELERAVAEGIGSVETSTFCYTRETSLDPDDPALARTLRTLRLKSDPVQFPEKFADLFPVAFDEVSVPLSGPLDFDDLVRKFESYQRETGGQLNEDEDTENIQYRSPEGWEWIVRLREGELVLRPERSADCLTIIRCVIKQFSSTSLRLSPGSSARP